MVASGTDGSIVCRRGRKVVAASVFIGDSSPLNSAKAILSATSSMLPEIDSFIELLYTAKKENFKRLATVIDNTAAISFIECPAKKIIFTSRVMQQYMLRKPALES